METFLLNPNTATQNPASKQGIATSQSESSEEFSPIMEEAVANAENANNSQGQETQENTDHRGTASAEATLLGAPSNISDENKSNTVLSHGSIEIQTNASKTDLAQTLVAPSNRKNEILTNITAENNIPKTDLTETLAASNIVSSDRNSEILTNIAGKLDVTKPFQSQLPLESATTKTQPVPAGEQTATAANSKVESLLLQQIQQILDQGKENGIVVIRGNDLSKGSAPGQTDSLQNLSSPLLTDTEKSEIQARQIGIPLTEVKDISPSTQKSAQLEGAHKNVSEQYFNAKLEQSKNNGSENSGQNNTGQKGSEQQNKTEAQQAITPTSTTVVDAKPVESSFGNQLGQVSSTTTQSTSIEGKFAPGTHTPVPEKELVANLIQRFNVNPRLQTSKLTMQLNPAELGALKVDILVKNDSISANIVAQSQQVIETLEKNMPRLRAVLEDQGFKIDAFEIAMDGDSGNQKELFQEQFSSQQQEFAFNESSSKKNDSFSVLLDSQEEVEEINEESSGVNLTV